MLRRLVQLPAEDGTVADREDRGHAASLVGEPGVPDGRYAAVHAVQPAQPGTPRDGLLRKPELTDLVRGDNSMLGARKPGDAGVGPG
jgi:hypothetical protein